MVYFPSNTFRLPNPIIGINVILWLTRVSFIFLIQLLLLNCAGSKDKPGHFSEASSRYKVPMAPTLRGQVGPVSNQSPVENAPQAGSRTQVRRVPLDKSLPQIAVTPRTNRIVKTELIPYTINVKSSQVPMTTEYAPLASLRAGQGPSLPPTGNIVSLAPLPFVVPILIQPQLPSAGSLYNIHIAHAPKIPFAHIRQVPPKGQEEGKDNILCAVYFDPGEFSVTESTDTCRIACAEADLMKVVYLKVNAWSDELQFSERICRKLFNNDESELRDSICFDRESRRANKQELDNRLASKRLENLRKKLFGEAADFTDVPIVITSPPSIGGGLSRSVQLEYQLRCLEKKQKPLLD
jgi:hypothetical protein